MMIGRMLGGAALVTVLALPAAGHAQNMQQMLGGLLTGNQSQDQALRDAYERGYQKGRQDEARLARRGPDDGRRGSDYGRQGPPQQQYDQGSDQYRR